jgi:hypothetical protein
MVGLVREDTHGDTIQSCVPQLAFIFSQTLHMNELNKLYCVLIFDV